MPTEFGDELDPRSVIPLSDSEIASIYAEAQGTQDFEPTSSYGLISLALLDTMIWMIVVEVLTRGRVVGLPMVMLFTVVTLFSFTLVALRKPAGLLTYLHLAKEKPPAKVDLSDVSVLAVVVNRIASAPIQHAQHIQQKIEKDRHAIADSLIELDKIEATLRDELRGTSDEPMRLLLESKRDSTHRALSRLRELDEELAQQLREAAEAVRPVTQMREKFERLSRLSTSLSKIQAAHRLAENADETVREQKLELQILRGVVAEANAKLLDIERLVDSQERAKAEMGLG